MLKKLATTACAVGLVLPALLAAQSTSRAVGVTVTTALTNVSSAVAQLPGDGSMASDNAPSLGVSGLAVANNLFAIATGGDQAAESNATVENVNLLDGLITADGVTALASSWLSGGAAASNTAGSALDNLVVNGVAVSSDVAPNTRMTLPGVGYVVLNEQQPSGDGVTSSGVTVNMIHVVLQNLFGQTTGEIIVGSASSQASQ